MTSPSPAPGPAGAWLAEIKALVAERNGLPATASTEIDVADFKLASRVPGLATALEAVLALPDSAKLDAVDAITRLCGQWGLSLRRWQAGEVRDAVLDVARAVLAAELAPARDTQGGAG